MANRLNNTSKTDDDELNTSASSDSTVYDTDDEIDPQTEPTSLSPAV